MSVLEVEDRDFYQGGTKKTVMVALLPAAKLADCCFSYCKILVLIGLNLHICVVIIV